MTPCIVAVGNRSSWRGVPCKGDGQPSWTGAVLIDEVVRSKGFAAAIATLVHAAPHGWDCAGHHALSEPDEFLGGSVVTEATSAEVLDRHFAVYVLDPEACVLEVFARTEGRWLEPARFDPAGVLQGVPDWYPQPGTRDVTRRRQPEAITRRLQAQCLELDIRWASLTEALRRWCTSQLGDLAGCAWLCLMEDSTAEHVRCLIDDTYVYAPSDACRGIFAAADGRIRSIDIDDVDRAEAIFGELGIRRSHAIPVLKTWLSLAFEAGSNQPGAYVDWRRGIKRWEFNQRRSDGSVTEDPIPMGWLPALLCWLF